jgi:hypothetical protein
MKTMDQKGEIRGKRDGESVNRRRVKVGHDKSGAVERRGEKEGEGRIGKHNTIKEMMSSKKEML